MPVLQGLSGSGAAPQQHKQPSRKGKKAWRKNVDISEVQEGLEALNEEIIQGGVAAEKDSADLFTLDTVGDTAAPASKKKRAAKPLKADEIIAQRSAVPGLTMRKRPANKTTDGILPAKRQRREPWVSHAEVARLRRVADGQHDSDVGQQEATYDVWGGAPATTSSKAAVAKSASSQGLLAEKQHPNNSTVDAATAEEDPSNFLPPTVKPKAPQTLRHKPISLAASGKAVPAVAKPAGSHSYNPLFEDYASRLRVESEKAVEAERKRLEREEAERLKAEGAARSAAEADAAEARAELSEWDEDSAWEGFETDVDDDEEEEGGTGKGAASAKKQPKRKTVVQRNRAKRRKAEERLQKHDASMKARDKQAERIRQIAAEVAEREAQRRAVARNGGSDAGSDEDEDEEEQREDVGAGEVKLRRKKLGKSKLSDEGDLELVLPEDLQDSLRLLKPEGNLLKDRYRSMLVRGKVESRRRIPFKKRPNVKFTEKWGYKDFRL